MSGASFRSFVSSVAAAQEVQDGIAFAYPFSSLNMMLRLQHRNPFTVAAIVGAPGTQFSACRADCSSGARAAAGGWVRAARPVIARRRGEGRRGTGSFSLSPFIPSLRRGRRRRRRRRSEMEVGPPTITILYVQ